MQSIFSFLDVALSRRTLLGYFVLAGGLLALSGCGLSEYEARMEQQQKRLSYMMEEARMLADGSIFFAKPKDSDKEALRPDQIFFRPPKGVATSPVEEKKPGLMMTFPATTGPFKDVLVGGRNSPNSEKFIQDVLTFLKVTSKDRKPKVAQSPGGMTLKYECISERKKPGSPGLNVDVCFYKELDLNIAIAYRWEDAKDNSAEPMINYSLASMRPGIASLSARIWIPPGGQSAPSKTTTTTTTTIPTKKGK